MQPPNYPKRLKGETEEHRTNIRCAVHLQLSDWVIRLPVCHGPDKLMQGLAKVQEVFSREFLGPTILLRLKKIHF